MHVQAEVCKSCGINCNPVMIINVKESRNPSRSLQQMMQSDVERKRAMLSSSAAKSIEAFGFSRQNSKKQNELVKNLKTQIEEKTIFNQSVFSTYHRSNTTLVTRNLIMTGVVLTFSNSDLKHDYLHSSSKNA